MDNKNIYEKYDWSSFKEPALKDKIRKIIEVIPEPVESIVDIGCGNGIITNVLGAHFNVTAVDRSKKALSFVQTKKVVASADDIPLPDDSFDMVFSSEMLEHLEDDTLIKSVAEMKRLSKKYIFITVPNSENPDKLSVKCPECGYVYNTSNHLRSFEVDKIMKLFPEYKPIKTFTYGRRSRYYNKKLLKLKKRLSPPSSWIPYYWVPKSQRETFCPNCEHQFYNPYHFHPIASLIDVLNVLISPKKVYWLFVIMEVK